ncbi:MAG: radical SAM protein [Candidatus Alcyoniella australis]|nr:radical SAM protein [Candidatus Alcyoniella australis]
MKVLLVQAAYLYQHHTHLHPLGVLYIAASLRQAGYDVAVLDMKLEELTPEAAMERVRAQDPDVVGISAMTYEAACMHDLAALVKKWKPAAKVIVGGAHPANDVERTLRDQNIDLLCIGEGEITLPEYLANLEAGGDWREVKGLAAMVDGKLVRNEPRPFINDIDTIPFPAWDLVPLERYNYIHRGGIIFKNRKFMTMFSSRSCPYRCIYCHNNLGKVWRPRQPERVVDEIQAVYERYGVREIEFMDDMFNLDLGRVQDICRMIIERGLKISITFPNGMRADRMDLETVKWLKRAGMYRTMYAIESGSERMQRYMKKNVKLDKAREIVEQTAKLGIMTHGAFMLGFPGETREEMLQTLRFAWSSKFHTAAFYRVLPFRGSELHKIVFKDHPEPEMTVEQFEFHSSDINLSEVPEEEVTRLRKLAYQKFYLNPIRLWRIFWRLPNKLVLLPYLVGMFVRRGLQR